MSSSQECVAVLPPLPSAARTSLSWMGDNNPTHYYTEAQMRAYATAAIAAMQRQGEVVAWLEPGTLNSASPRDFADAIKKWPDDYDDWFPVYALPPQPPTPSPFDICPECRDEIAYCECPQPPTGEPS